MFELRWIKVRKMEGDCFVYERVLQYRNRLNPIEVELHDPIWSQWYDVEEIMWDAV